MSIRIKFDLDLSLSENTSGAEELGKSPPWSGVNDTMDDGGTFRRRFAGGVTDQLVDINGLTTCKFLAIKSSQPITFKKNSSGGESTSITPLGFGATDGILIMTTDSITSLYVSNPGSLAAEVTFYICGTF